MLEKCLLFSFLFVAGMAYLPSYEQYYSPKFLQYFSKIRSGNFFLDTINRSLGKLSDSSNKCKEHLKSYETGLKHNSTWTAYYLDSSGLMPENGWLTGSTVNLGNFDECVEQRSDKFEAQYCWLKVEPQGEPSHRMSYPPNNTPIVFSICLPQTCSEEDLSNLTTNAGKSLNATILPTCQAKRPTLTPADGVVIIFFGLVAIFTLSTLIPKSLIPIQNEGFIEFWQSFDISRNTRSLLPLHDGNILACMYSIRFLSQCLVLWYHFLIIGLVGNNPFQNKFFLDDFYRSWIGIAFSETVLVVDVFFMMSGLLLTYNSLKRKTNLDLPKYFIHRYLRLTPPIMASVLFISTFCNKMCTGPLCILEIDKEKDLCSKYWWTNLLYINNFYPGILKSCMPHSWYLATDFQLFCFSPLIILLVNKWPQYLIKVIIAIITLSIFFVCGISYAWDLPIDNLHYKSVEEIEYYFSAYTSPLTRAGPWAVGMLIGALLFRVKQNNIAISKWNALGYWILAGLASLASVWLSYPWHQYSAEPPLPLVALFNGIQRNLFALSIGWIIFASANGLAGPLGTFLSLPAWEPLGKLTYSFYVIHKSIVSLHAGEARAPYHFSLITQTPIFLGLVVLSTVAALLLYLTFEAPFVHIEKIIFAKRKPPTATAEIQQTPLGPVSPTTS